MKQNELYIQDMPELEQYKWYSWGEDIYLVKDEFGDRYLINKATGKIRQISSPGYVVGFSDDEIDFATIDKLPHARNAHERRMNYGAIAWWDSCKDGLIALCWTLYPDGRYYADEDGYGMEDNGEEKIYCVLDDNLNVVQPFTIVPDIEALLNELRKAKK